MSDDVSVKFGAQIGDLLDGIGEAKAALSEFGEQVGSQLETLNVAFEGLAAIMAGSMFSGFVREANDAVSQTLQLSQRLGITTEEASGLRVALGNVGVGTDEFLGIMQRMDRQLKTSEDSFTQMGIATRNSSGEFRSQSAILEDVISKLETFKSGTDRNEASMVLLGGRVGDLTNLMRLNKEALQEGADEAQRLGLVFGEDAVKGMLQYKKAVAEVDEVILSFKVTLAEQLQPTLVGLSEWMKTEGPAAIGTFSSAVQGVLVSITLLITGTKQLSNELSYLKDRLAVKSEGWGLFADLDKVDAKLAALDSKYKSSSDQIAQEGKKAYLAIFGLGVDGNQLPKPNIELPSQGTQTFAGASSLGAGSDDSALKIAQNDAQTELELQKILLQGKKDLLDQEVAANQISKQEELRELQTVLDAEYQASYNALQKELSLNGLSAEQTAALLNREQVLTAQYFQQSEKLSAQAAAAEAEQSKKAAEAYKSAFDVIDRDMDTVLAGILQGTITWQAAMAKTFSNLAVGFIEEIAKMTVKWAAFQAAQAEFGAGDNITKAIGASVPSALGGTQQASVLNAALTRLGVVLGANTAAHATGTVAVTANTAAAATDTAATASSTLATTAGTLATGANTATTASSGILHVAAMAENTIATAANTIATWAGDGLKALIPSFEVGTSYAPGGLSFLHPGEIVLNPAVSAGVRSGTIGINAGGGGSAGGNITVNMNVSAVDGQSVANLFKNNGAALAAVMASQSRTFNPALRR